MDIFIGNIPDPMTKDILKELFQKHGKVSAVRFFKDKSYAFVTMPYAKEAASAIRFFNGLEFYGKTLIVESSKPKAFKPRVFISRAWQEKAEFQDY